jgi:hypothetical protein
VHYDLALIRLANNDSDGAMAALQQAISLNAKLKEQASRDGDMDALRNDPRFIALIGPAEPL